jgi:flavin reductase (NADH)
LSRVQTEDAHTATLHDLFREALSHWVSGVTVVAAKDEAGEVRGMTASSFASLSLEPPLVLVCVDERANLLPVLEGAGGFTINLLAEGQQEASGHFAGQPAARLLENPPFPVHGDLILDEALAALVCSSYRIYPGGDHRIVVGKVEKVVLGEDRPPLVYYRRSYRKLI